MPESRRWFAIVSLLILCGTLRLWSIGKPLTDKQYWRQTDTAAIARNFYVGGMRILYPQVDWRGNTTGYVESEFPIYPFMVATLYQMFGSIHESLGRLLSLIFALATVWFFYQFVLKMFDHETAVYSALLYAVSPMVIHYTRAFMPESMLMFCYVTGLYLFYLWIQERSKTVGVLALLVVTLALLIKLTAVIIFIPMLGMLYDRDRWLFIKKWQNWMFFSLAVLAPVAWYWHAYQLFTETKLSFGILSGAGYNKFATWAYLFNWKVWEIIFSRIFMTLLTPVGAIVCLGSLIFSFVRHDILKGNAFLYAWVVSIILYFLCITDGILVLEYYQIYAVPVAGILIARGIIFLKMQMANKWVPRITYGIIVLCSIAFYAHYFVWAHSDYADQSYRFAQKVLDKTPEDALFIVVDTDGLGNPAWYRRMKYRISSPSLLYYLNRKGWVILPEEMETAEPIRFDEMILQGAQYFVVPMHVIEKHPQVRHWIELRHLTLLERDGHFFMFELKRTEFQSFQKSNTLPTNIK